MNSATDAVYWTDVDQRRLQRDLADVQEFAPRLEFEPPSGGSAGHHGRWTGELPLWPFARERPQGLARLLEQGLIVEVLCSAAHPVVPPYIFPLDPRPQLVERSMNLWHVAPRGQLCLMQSNGAWRPSDRVSDLLLKACGWHVEYALMKAGVVNRMSERGIAQDAGLDHLVQTAVDAIETAEVAAGRAGDE